MALTTPLARRVKPPCVALANAPPRSGPVAPLAAGVQFGVAAVRGQCHCQYHRLLRMTDLEMSPEAGGTARRAAVGLLVRVVMITGSRGIPRSLCRESDAE